METPTWICKQCGSLNPFSAMVCDCGHDGRVPVEAEKPGAGRSEHDKRPGETSREYAHRMIAIAKVLASQATTRMNVAPKSEAEAAEIMKQYGST